VQQERLPVGLDSIQDCFVRRSQTASDYPSAPGKSPVGHGLPAPEQPTMRSNQPSVCTGPTGSAQAKSLDGLNMAADKAKAASLNHCSSAFDDPRRMFAHAASARQNYAAGMAGTMHGQPFFNAAIAPPRRVDLQQLRFFASRCLVRVGGVWRKETGAQPVLTPHNSDPLVGEFSREWLNSLIP
jgi:hypothetical protein